MKKIKIGIVGCGRIAQHYEMIFKSGDVTNFEIIAVCDLDIKKAEKLSEKFNCKYFEKMLKNDKNFVKLHIDFSLLA